MSEFDSYFTNDDKPFSENINDALLLSNVFDLTVPIELPLMFGNGEFVDTTGRRKCGVAITQIVDNTDLTINASSIVGTGSLDLKFYPNFNSYGSISRVEWVVSSGTVTVDIYDANDNLIASNIPNGVLDVQSTSIKTLQNFKFRLNFTSATLTNFKVTMVNKDTDRWGAEVGIDDVNGLDDRLDNIESDINSIADVIYPVGSIYMSVNSTSPSTLFGGTWVQLENRFLLGAGSSYTAGNTGGSADAVVVSHTHIQNSHNHTQNAHNHKPLDQTNFIESTKGASTGDTKRNASANTSGNYYWQSTEKPTIAHHTVTANATATNQSATATNQYTGVDGTGKNMPPYLTVYMWERTA